MTEPKILLYYAFAPVPDPNAVRLWQRELCDSLGIRGRIIISKHGINGTVGGELDACKQYLRRTREYAPFAGVDVKWSAGSGFDKDTPQLLHGIDRSPRWRTITDFPKLSVRVRNELVAFGIPDEIEVDEHGVVGGGERLSPEAVNELVASRDDVVFFDGRNSWEAEIGRFSGAVVPDVRTTHDFIAQIDSGEFDDLKSKPVITYCTGGIRCEILSAAMKHRGFEEVYQIDGGIVRYGEAFGNDGLWEGSLAIFDGREAMDFAPGAVVIGSCSVCDAPASQLANCVPQETAARWNSAPGSERPAPPTREQYEALRTESSCKTRFVVCENHFVSPCPEHRG